MSRCSSWCPSRPRSGRSSSPARSASQSSMNSFTSPSVWPAATRSANAVSSSCTRKNALLTRTSSPRVSRSCQSILRCCSLWAWPCQTPWIRHGWLSTHSFMTPAKDVLRSWLCTSNLWQIMVSYLEHFASSYNKSYQILNLKQALRVCSKTITNQWWPRSMVLFSVTRSRNAL